MQPGDADEKLQEIFEEAGEVQGVPEALIDAYKTVLAQDLPGGTKVRLCNKLEGFEGYGLCSSGSDSCQCMAVCTCQWCRGCIWQPRFLPFSQTAKQPGWAGWPALMHSTIAHCCIQPAVGKAPRKHLLGAVATAG